MQASTTPPAGIANLRKLLALLLCLISTPVWAWPAQVERVVDGDTIEVRANGRPVTIRIFGIDAPERGQPGGDAARAALAAMIEGHRIDVDALGPDRYGRTVARLDRQGRDVGLSLVRAGHAWQFTRYDNGTALRAAQQFARRNRLGLWAGPAAQAPWQWRAAGRSQPVASRAPGCDRLPRCKELASCAAAFDLVARCGPGRLDGDRDGIPCEALCAPTG